MELMESLLSRYEDKDVVEWIKFGFPMSRDEDPIIIPATTNHSGALLHSEAIEQYLDTELRHNAIMGPFNIPPFMGRIGISPLSTRPKKNSSAPQVILNLSYPEGNSINNGIDKNFYCGKSVQLTYPTIDTLLQCIFELGMNARLWKRDVS